MALTVLSMFCRFITGGCAFGGAGNAAPKLGGVTIRATQSGIENGSNDVTCAVSRKLGAGTGSRAGDCTDGVNAIALAVMTAAPAVAAFFANAFIFRIPSIALRGP